MVLPSVDDEKSSRSGRQRLIRRRTSARPRPAAWRTHVERIRFRARSEPDFRGDGDTDGALLDNAGIAIIHSGIRTPVDMILYAHYLRRVDEIGATRTQRDREQAEAMSPSESIALGLTATSG